MKPQDIFNRITGKTSGMHFLAEWHCALMERFGWIPIEEFKNLPGDTLMSMLDHVKKMNKLENKQYGNKT